MGERGMVSTTDTAGSGAVRHTGARSDSAIRFTLTVAVWVVGLFGLMRVGWVQQYLLLPFAGMQQRLAIDLMGAPPNVVVVDLSCTGADAIALCLGVILAFPASWRARMRGGVLGLLLIVVLNTLRIGTLSFAAGKGALMNLLHVYVWPAILIVAVAVYVFAWMNGDGALTRASERGRAGVQSVAVGRRFLVLTGLLVAAYFALAPSVFQSALLLTVGGWAASSASAIIMAFGGVATVSRNVLSTAHGSFIVTQECLATPLIPVYAAAVLSMPLSLARRATALLAGPLLFFGLGTSRLLVLALPSAVVGSHVAAIHAFSQVLAALVLVAAAAVWRQQHVDRGPRQCSRGDAGDRWRARCWPWGSDHCGVLWSVGRPRRSRASCSTPSTRLATRKGRSRCSRLPARSAGGALDRRRETVGVATPDHRCGSVGAVAGDREHRPRRALPPHRGRPARESGPCVGPRLPRGAGPDRRTAVRTLNGVGTLRVGRVDPPRRGLSPIPIPRGRRAGRTHRPVSGSVPHRDSRHCERGGPAHRLRVRGPDENGTRWRAPDRSLPGAPANVSSSKS